VLPEVKKAKYDEKKLRIPMYDQPEGLVLAIKKTPIGRADINAPKSGIRLKCNGSETIKTAKPTTARIEFTTLMVIVDEAMSSLANQLMLQ
jgi:hypothetical protein